MQSYLCFHVAQHNPAFRELDVLKGTLETPHPCGHQERTALMKFPFKTAGLQKPQTFLGSCEASDHNQKPVALKPGDL